MPVRKHSHLLKRLRYKTGTEIYFCTLDCSYKIECALALGKVSICNLCGNEFVLNDYHVTLARPHCNDCSKTKVKGTDGKNHFIRRGNIPVLDSVAEDKVNDLRHRLNSVVGVIESDEKDI